MTPRGPGRPAALTLYSAAPWRATCYLATYLVTGPVLFAVATTAVVAAAALSQLTLALPGTVAGAWVVRGCAQAERARAVLVAGPVPYEYREVTEPGLAAQLKTRWCDPATARDCACLILLAPFLLVLDALALAVWLLLLACAALPLWFTAVTSTLADGTTVTGVRIGRSDGSGPGVWVDDWPTALAAAALFLVLAMFFSHAVVAAARLHLNVTRALLRPPSDPLAQVKRVLAEPGPLSKAAVSLTPSAGTAGAAPKPMEETADERDAEPAGLRPGTARRRTA